MSNKCLRFTLGYVDYGSILPYEINSKLAYTNVFDL